MGVSTLRARGGGKAAGARPGARLPVKRAASGPEIEGVRLGHEALLSEAL